MTENYRDKIIGQNIAFCLRFKHFMDEWEEKFINSVDSQEYPLTQKQFNKLQDVTERVTKKVA